MMEKDSRQDEYEEVDLKPYIDAVWKNRILVFLVFAITVLVVGLWSLFSPKVYSVDAVLQIGMVRDSFIEEPLQIKEKVLADIYGQQVKEELGLVDYPQIDISHLSGDSLLKFETLTGNPKEAEMVLNALMSFIIEEHRELIELSKESLEADIDILMERLELVRLEKGVLHETITDLLREQGRQPISETYFLFQFLQNELSEARHELDTLEADFQSREESLATIEFSSILKSAAASENPVKPRVAFNLVIASILGLFFGLAAVLIKTWWERSKQKRLLEE